MLPRVPFCVPGVVQRLIGLCLLPGSLQLAAQGAATNGEPPETFLQTYCMECHSGPKAKADVSLENHLTPDVWERNPSLSSHIADQTSSGAMPPENAPQPSPTERIAFLKTLQDSLSRVAIQSAGDPGEIVLRRLNNAEYTYTLRDLTGIDSLEPASTFPSDSASGEGFLNQGQSLVMSPSLLVKYLDSAKELSQLLVLLPDGIGFNASTSRRDRTETLLSSIRSLYQQYTVPGADSSHNLQGIRFNNQDGGVIPLTNYLRATLELREHQPAPTAPPHPSGADINATAAQHGLSPNYLTRLWHALNDTHASPLLDPIRAHWSSARPGDENAIADHITAWQQAVWRFTTVGHIGKRDGPKAWQEPVNPIVHSQNLSLPLPNPNNALSTDVFLEIGNAGDTNTASFVLLENLRLVFPGQPDLPLKDLPNRVALEQAARGKVLAQSENCLQLAATLSSPPDESQLTTLAAQHHLDTTLLAAWLDLLGLSRNETPITNHLTGRINQIAGYDFVQGWTGGGDLSVIANSSDQAVRIPGNMQPHSLAVHPSPTDTVVISWQSPVATHVTITGQIQHAHPECGNGTAWTLQLQSGRRLLNLAHGTTQGNTPVPIQIERRLKVYPGDTLSLAINSRDGNHACDLTSVQLIVRDDTRTWNLATDVSPNILAGNPLPDAYANPDVWHFHSTPNAPTPISDLFNPGSLLSQWFEEDADRPELARQLTALLQSPVSNQSDNPANTQLANTLLSIHGPLLAPLLQTATPSIAPASPITQPNLLQANLTQGSRSQPVPVPFETLAGLHPNGAHIPATSLCLRAPATLHLTLPSSWTQNGHFAATARIEPNSTPNGIAQIRLLNAPDYAALPPQKHLNHSLQPDTPILTFENSLTHQQITTALEDFRSLFPAALCYSKIVPVDEVVTLTLFYREDDHLQQLMLTPKECAELDRLWSQLHYVSQDALKQVDAFEQLWQYATQDADPSAFEPLRAPTYQKAEAFRQWLVDTEPRHVDALVEFASRAYRRPLTANEKKAIPAFYQTQRDLDVNHEEAVRSTLARILVSPDFLYRIETPPSGPNPTRVSAWELATRLSYFLHASAPDDALRQAADSGQLVTPQQILKETHRLLHHPNIERLSTEFATAWLHLYDFASLDEKSPRHFPEFPALRESMLEETKRFFTALFRENRPVLDLINADYSFLNEDLARFYAIPDALWTQSRDTGDGWRLVIGLQPYSRGGLLGQAAVLSRQSGASRTSPILRGNWIAEVLLGDKLPPPPKNVPQLPADEASETLTMRELTEKHSTDPSCYGCHRLIDPYGYTLESFDAIGRHRSHDLAGHPILDSAKVVDGTQVDGFHGLRQYLLQTKGDTIVRQFCKKLLGYALGRRVLLSDSPLIDEMVEQLKANEYRVGSAVDTLVLSPQFLEIRGRDHLSQSTQANPQTTQVAAITPPSNP